MKLQNYKNLFIGLTKKIKEFDFNSFLEEIKNLNIDDFKNINYKRNYYYYNSHNIENLKLASNILIKEGKITCNNCIKILNKESRLRTDEESLFKEYASYIKKL